MIRILRIRNRWKRRLVLGNNRGQKGFAALLVVVVVTAAGLLLALSAAWLGLGALDAGVSTSGGGAALAGAEGCTEEVQRRLLLNSSYQVGTGWQTVAVGTHSCRVRVTSLSGNRRRIESEVTKDLYTRRTLTEVQLGTRMAVTVWQFND